jgi:hypothetical protein
MAYHMCVLYISPFHKTFAGHITVTNTTSVRILTSMGMRWLSPLFLNRLLHSSQRYGSSTLRRHRCFARFEHLWTLYHVFGKCRAFFFFGMRVVIHS